MILPALLAAILAPTLPVQGTGSGQMTLGDLQTLCAGREPGEACRFYLLGVFEGAGMAAGLAKDSAHFCTPPDVTQTEMVAVTKRLAATDLAAYPKDSEMPAVAFIGAALTKNYPCR